MALVDEALEQYRRSAKLDETNVSALHGMIGCQLEEGATPPPGGTSCSL